MKHLFIPYELALLAKEKGFNEECLAIFSQNNGFYPDGTFHLNHPHPFTNTQIEPIIQDNREIPVYISAPLYQQIIDWFREKRNIHISYDRNPIAKNKFMYFYFIKLGNGFDTTAKYSGDFNSVYEALDKAIEEAFKLI